MVTKEQLQDYLTFFIQLVSLQRKLIPVFEASVEIEPVTSEYAQIFAKHYQDVPVSSTLLEVIRPGRLVSDIFRAWPSHPFPPLTMIAPMLHWVKPRTGVMNFEGQKWLFQMHGMNELAFQKLPTKLEPETVQAIEDESPSVLTDIPEGMWEEDEYPHLDVTYLPGGQTDGVRPVAAWLYASSRRCGFSDIDESKHKEYLEEAVRTRILTEKYGHYFLVEETSHR